MTRNIRNWLYGICFFAVWAGINSRRWFDPTQFDERVDAAARQSLVNPTLVTDGTFGKFEWLTVECTSSPTGAVWNWTLHPSGLLALLGIGLLIAIPVVVLWRLVVNLDWLRDRCDVCGYSRRGIQGHCPECGSELRRATEFEQSVLYEMGFGRCLLWRWMILVALLGLAFAFLPFWGFLGRLQVLAIGAGAVPPASHLPFWPRSIPMYIITIWTWWALVATIIQVKKSKVK